MTDRERMQQALDALEGIQWPGSPSFVKAAITTLRERLAQPEQCQYPNCKCATESPCLKGLAQQEQEPVFNCPRCGHCCPQSNILAAWMIQRGYATGHGDTIEDLIKELEWQVAEREREACAALVDANAMACHSTVLGSLLQSNADAIRARGAHDQE